MNNLSEATDTLNLLIVEDDLSWRYAHASFFKNLGFNVIKEYGISGVSNRKDAIEKLCDPKPDEKVDVIILDIVMDLINFGDVSQEQLQIEKEEGYSNIKEGERLLEMLKQGNFYETVGCPIIIVYTTLSEAYYNMLLEKYPNMLHGYIHKSMTDENQIKELVEEGIRRKHSYFKFE